MPKALRDLRVLLPRGDANAVSEAMPKALRGSFLRDLCVSPILDQSLPSPCFRVASPFGRRRGVGGEVLYFINQKFMVLKPTPPQENRNHPATSKHQSLKSYPLVVAAANS
jgi:hypothetical protein